MRKLCIVFCMMFCFMLSGCHPGEINSGLVRQYDKENGVVCYSWYKTSESISCVKVK